MSDLLPNVPRINNEEYRQIIHAAIHDQKVTIRGVVFDGTVPNFNPALLAGLKERVDGPDNTSNALAATLNQYAYEIRCNSVSADKTLESLERLVSPDGNIRAQAIASFAMVQEMTNALRPRPRSATSVDPATAVCPASSPIVVGPSASTPPIRQ